MKRKFSLTCLSIDIGGAFPSDLPQEIRDQIGSSDYPSINYYGEYLASMRELYDLTNDIFILEPGTALVASSILLVGHVRSVNIKHSCAFVNTDLSRTLLGGLKQDIYFPLDIAPSCSLNNLHYNYRLTGFSCVEGDFISPLIYGPLLYSKLKDYFAFCRII